MPSKARIADNLKYFDPVTYRRVVARILLMDREAARAKVETVMMNLETAQGRLAALDAECDDFDATAPTTIVGTAVTTVPTREANARDFLPPITKPAANGHLFTDRETNFGAY